MLSAVYLTLNPAIHPFCAGAGCHIAPLRGSRGSIAEILPALLLHEAVAGSGPRPQQATTSVGPLTPEESARAAYDRAVTARNDGARVRMPVIPWPPSARAAVHSWAGGMGGAPPAADARPENRKASLIKH